MKSLSVRFVIALSLFNMTSVRAGRVLLTLYTIKIGGGPLAIGMLAASFSVIPVMFSWVGGRWVDRFGSRWLLFLGVGGSAGGMLLPFFMPNMTSVFLAGTLSGLSMTFCNVSLQNLVGLISCAGERAKNFSNYTLAGSLSSFVGPIIAGFAIDHFGHHYTCIIVVALAAIPLTMVVMHGSALPRGSGSYPRVSATASRATDNSITVTLAHTDPAKPVTIELTLTGLPSKASAKEGRILTAPALTDINTPESPNRVAAKTWTDFIFDGKKLIATLPPGCVAAVSFAKKQLR